MSNKIHHLQDVNNEMLAYYFNDLKSDTSFLAFRVEGDKISIKEKIKNLRITKEQ